MKKTLLFYPSILLSKAHLSSPEIFDRSIEAFENEKYQTALNYLLDSINPAIRANHPASDSGEQVIPHGPLQIRVKLDQENMYISASLVTLSPTASVAMMRQVAAINFNDLDLTRLVLQDKGLSFHFSCPLIYSHPQKIRRIFQEICHIGVKYDYKFRNEFQVARIEAPSFSPYTEEEVTYTYKTIQESCKTCFEAIRHFETLRQYNEIWLLLRTTFLQIDYVAHPQGKLCHILGDAISDMDRNLPLTELNADGKAVLLRLQEMTRQEIAEHLYRVQTFIPEKKRCNLQKLKEDYESCYKQVSVYMETGNYRKVCLSIIHKLYETYYFNQMDDELNALFVEVFKAISSQPWVVAAPILYQFLDNIMQNRIKRNYPPVAA